MYRFLRRKKGQSIIEYSIFIGVVVAAWLAINLLLERSHNQRISDAAAGISPGQFEILGANWERNLTTESNSTTKDYADEGEGTFTTNIITDERNEYVTINVGSGE